jgi:hypothetical protein
MIEVLQMHLFHAISIVFNSLRALAAEPPLPPEGGAVRVKVDPRNHWLNSALVTGEPLTENTGLAAKKNEPTGRLEPKEILKWPPLFHAARSVRLQC